jgi:desampylase
MDLRISRVLLAQIVAHAQDSTPEECCGLLLGLGQPEAVTISAVMPAPNVATDPMMRFEVDPETLLAAGKAARQGGPSVLGHYHSHPRGPAAPSVADAHMAARDGRFALIVGDDWSVTAWREGTTGGLFGVFKPITIVILDDLGHPSGLASGARAGT